MWVFFAVLGGVTFWQFLPEYVFPMLGSLAFLCWVAPRNATANFIGAGFGEYLGIFSRKSYINRLTPIRWHGLLESQS